MSSPRRDGSEVSSSNRTEPSSRTTRSRSTCHRDPSRSPGRSPGSCSRGAMTSQRSRSSSARHARGRAPVSMRSPNRFPLIRHDFTRPFFSWGSVPLYPSDASATLTFPVSFNVTDDIYGSGVKSWTLQKKVVGASTWATVKKGTARHPTVQFTGLGPRPTTCGSLRSTAKGTSERARCGG